VHTSIASARETALQTTTAAPARIELGGLRVVVVRSAWAVWIASVVHAHITQARALASVLGRALAPQEHDSTKHRRECEEEAASLGAITTSEECASKVLKRAECGREFTFRAPTSTLHYLSAALSLFSSSYPSWGCRCCSVGSGPSDEAHPDWSVYRLQARIVS